MANIKTYEIRINGLQQSIDAVDSLNKQLDKLEERMKTLSSAKVSTGGGSSSTPRSNASALSEEEKLAKQIKQIDEKREAYSKEIYQNYLAAKDVLKETVKDQKQIAAAERLQADAYTNTMSGMKQKLADIKTAMQTVDLGDTETLKKMTTEANKLNEKLLEIEKSYGQFGRQVGNYKSAFDGLQNVSVTVAGVTREFGSAREASKTLKNELIGLEAAGSGNTEVAKELRSEYYKLQSAMDDATKSSKAMDEAMDYMSSFAALASVGNGIQAFFGFDDSEIQKSIQKLVALQNVLQGIETIRKQMETEEGLGKIFSDGSNAVDAFVAKITGAKVGVNGLTMASRTATVAVRGLSLALKAIGVGFITAAIAYAVEGLQTLIKSLDTMKTKTDALESSIKALNRQYDQRKDLLAGSYLRGALTTEEFLAEQYRIENEYIERQIDLLQQRQAIANDRSWISDFFSPSGEVNGFSGRKFGGSASSSSWNLLGNFSYDVSSVKEAEEAWKKLNKAVMDGKDYFSEYGEGLTDWYHSLYTTVTQTEDVMKGMGNIVLSDTIGQFQELEQKFKDGKISAEDYASGLKELADAMNSNEVLNSVIANLDKYIPDDEVRSKVENIIQSLYRLNDEFNAVSEAQVHRWNQVRIDAMEEGAAKIAAQMAEDERHEIAQYARTQEQKELIEKKYQRKRLEETKKHNKKVSQESKKNAREQAEAERDLANLRIANMKEGLNKVLKQLEEERKARLKKVEIDGRLIAERQAEINLQFDKKVLEERKEWTKKIEKAYRDMWDNIYNYSLQTQGRIVELLRNATDIAAQNTEFKRSETMDKKNASYGVQGGNQLSWDTQSELGFLLLQNKEMSELYEERKKVIKDYWYDRIETEKLSAKVLYDAQVQYENERYDQENRDRVAHWKEQQELQSEWADKQKEYYKGLAEIEGWSQSELDAQLNNVDREYKKAAEELFRQYQLDEKTSTEEHNQELIRLEQEKVLKIQNVNAESYREQLQELRDFQTAISNLESKQPVYNAWGITDFKKTNENNRTLLESYRKLVEEIIDLKAELQRKLDEKEISFDDFQNANRELDTFVDNVGQKMDDVKGKLKLGNQIGQFIQDIEKYLQEAVRSFNTIMQAVWDAQDNQFDKEQEYLDKMNDELDKKLDEQQEIISEHKSAIDSIEDELANARGSRRQHLINQINAEIEAQRRAQQEEKKIQKEKEAAQKKQDALELKRKKAQYKRDMLQAIVNGAMAVTMAAVNSWPVPAIPMMALAGATTAAQIAIMASNKPYAKGGLLEGKSHAQGGIPIPGTGIEVEGKEYVIRKKSTAQNIDILDYINKSERKLDLSDFIDFYAGKAKKNITSMSPRTKFADGGALPMLNNNYTFDDRLLNAFERYAEKPSVVQVVDILDRADNVRNVQTLAGLSPTTL